MPIMPDIAKREFRALLALSGHNQVASLHFALLSASVNGRYGYIEKENMPCCGCILTTLEYSFVAMRGHRERINGGRFTALEVFAIKMIANGKPNWRHKALLEILETA